MIIDEEVTIPPLYEAHSQRLAMAKGKVYRMCFELLGYIPNDLHGEYIGES